MSTTIYGIKTCDTCRKAARALPDAVFRDIRVDPLTAQERAEFLDTFGDKLINRASTTWRGLDEEERTSDADALLAAYPTLMKRPVIQSGEALLLGWSASTQAALAIG